MKTLPTFVLVFLLSATSYGQDSRLKFEKRDDLGPLDKSTAAVVSGDNLVVAGFSGPTGHTSVIRSYSKADGSLVWSDQAAPGQLMTTADRAVYVSGQQEAAPLTAYDGTLGARVWTVSVPFGAVSIAANFNAVVVAGTQQVSIVDYGAVRAYDPGDGRLLWSDTYRQFQSPGHDFASEVAIDGFNVFVAGSWTQDNGATNTLVLRSYDARTGNLRWSYTRPGFLPTAIATGPQRLYVAGYQPGTRSAKETTAFIGAFETGSGDRLWEDVSQPGSFVSLNVQRGRLTGSGREFICPDPQTLCNEGGMVRTYDAEAGFLLWSDHISPGPGNNFHGGFEQPASLALTDDTAYYFGTSGVDFDYSEWLVKGYDLDRGAVSFQERSNGSPFAMTAAASMTTDGTDVFAVGNVGQAASDTDFAIRGFKPAAVTTGSSGGDEAINPGILIDCSSGVCVAVP